MLKLFIFPLEVEQEKMLPIIKDWDWKKTLSLLLLILLLFCVGALFWAYLNGKFDSPETLKAYVGSFGVFAPIVLTVIQAGQVVVPVLPGFLGCAVGAALFGPVAGFICNYIGICTGSIIAYFLAHHYGVGLVRSLFKEEKYAKWEKWIGKWKCYPLILFVVTLLPLFPDDFFCYFSGLTTMKARRFIWIILLGKPWCILGYSLLFGGIL